MRVAAAVDTETGDPFVDVAEAVEAVENADVGGVHFIRFK